MKGVLINSGSAGNSLEQSFRENSKTGGRDFDAVGFLPALRGVSTPLAGFFLRRLGQAGLLSLSVRIAEEVPSRGLSSSSDSLFDKRAKRFSGTGGKDLWRISA